MHVIMFKTLSDLDQIGVCPLHDTIKSLLESLISNPSYNPDEDGYLVLIEPGDIDRALRDLDLPWRLSEVPFEGVSQTPDGHYHAVYLPNNQFSLSFLIPDVIFRSNGATAKAQAQGTP